MKSLLTAIICMTSITAAYAQSDSLVKSDTTTAAQQDTSDGSVSLCVSILSSQIGYTK